MSKVYRGKISMASVPRLRVARPTDDINALLHFYRDGLGLRVIGRFEDHNGFDGIMLGSEGPPNHFEFTRARCHAAGCAPTKDDLLVFHLPDAGAWQAAVVRMRAARFAAVKAFNTTGDRNGATFEDPDGYRAVLENALGRLTNAGHRVNISVQGRSSLRLLKPLFAWNLTFAV